MRENFRLVSGRRAIGLGRRPLLQLKLPLILLAITVSFGALFAAHTWAAWGQLISFGASEPWVGQLADEILRDYLTVSTAIATAYVAFLMLTCLAYTHRLLGPIVALERHLHSLRLGNATTRIRLREGDPLAGVAEELNSLGPRLRSAPEADAPAA